MDEPIRIYVQKLKGVCLNAGAVEVASVLDRALILSAMPAMQKHGKDILDVARKINTQEQIATLFVSVLTAMIESEIGGELDN